MRVKGLVATGICLALAGPAVMVGQGMGQGPAPTGTVAPAESLGSILNISEMEVVGAAEAMPAEKYDFAPSTSMGLYTGVRSFSSQVKHLAEANYEFFAPWGGPGAVDPRTIEALTAKDQIIAALKKSYEYAHQAVNSITPQNAFDAVQGFPRGKSTRASMTAFGIAHSMDHYGQMVEYLRMNGIVPPASRPRPQSPTKTSQTVPKAPGNLSATPQ